jgi:hypothetical protein
LFLRLPTTFTRLPLLEVLAGVLRLLAPDGPADGRRFALAAAKAVADDDNGRLGERALARLDALEPDIRGQPAIALLDPHLCHDSSPW